MKGVVSVKTNPKVKVQEDITKTKGFQEAMDDVRLGRTYHAESVDDMFKQILGK